MATTISMLNSNFDADKLTNEIFSILENKFLFGYDNPKISSSFPFEQMKSGDHITGKVRILSIDGGGATDGILSAISLVHLESVLQQNSQNPNARISHYFDIVAGSGAGGILASLLFTIGKDGGPMFTAKEALEFLVENRREISSPAGGFRRLFRSQPEKVYGKVFGDLTLKDTMKSVLVPCYDLKSGAAFVFSRADALEMDGYDFKIKDVCAATSASVVGSVVVKSVDKKNKISAAGGELAISNPTAAAITHVLNNKQEFPFCNGVEDLLVVSLGNGETYSGITIPEYITPLPAAFVKIAGEGVADMVDQAVSMAFGESRSTDYVRIQANGIGGAKFGSSKCDKNIMLKKIEEMLAQKNVESVLFKGKKVVKNTNLNKLELLGVELIKEHQRRKSSILATVLLKQAATSPRTSSATTLSTSSSN